MRQIRARVDCRRLVREGPRQRPVIGEMFGSRGKLLRRKWLRFPVEVAQMAGFSLLD